MMLSNKLVSIVIYLIVYSVGNVVAPPQSTTTTTTQKPVIAEPEPKCLHGDDTVLTMSEGSKQIKHLLPGDKVMSVSDTGEVIYDEVYLMSHASPTLKAQFTRIETTRTNLTLRLTHGHMLIVDGVEKRADAVTPGAGILVRGGGGAGVRRDAVGAVAREERRGVYSPVTTRGRLIVNGLLVSSYSDLYRGLLGPPAHLHTLLWPVRQLYHIMPHLINTGYDGYNGKPVWIMYLQKLFEKMI